MLRNVDEGGKQCCIAVLSSMYILTLNFSNVNIFEGLPEKFATGQRFIFEEKGFPPYGYFTHFS
jgi:hypothetical protein